MPREGVAARTRVRDFGDIVGVACEVAVGLDVDLEVGWEGSGAWIGSVGEMPRLLIARGNCVGCES